MCILKRKKKENKKKDSLALPNKTKKEEESIAKNVSDET